MRAPAQRICTLAVSTAMVGSLMLDVSSAEPVKSKNKENPPKVEQFRQDGVIVALHSFYRATEATREKQEDLQLAGPRIADFALVTAKGVFAFLETPQNQEALAEIKPPQPIRVRGKLLASGKLLAVDWAEKLEKAPDGIDLDEVSKSEPKPVSLDGTNKCQCGLRVGELPHSCKLGHLHHLETPDGTIYNYLQFGPGRRLFLGKDAHFKKTHVKGKLFAGHFVLVEEAEVAGKAYIASPGVKEAARPSRASSSLRD